MYIILYFPYLLGGFLHIYTCTCTIYCGLWPPDNVSCLFLTWYQSIGFFSIPHAQLVLNSDPIFSPGLPSSRRCWPCCPSRLPSSSSVWSLSSPVLDRPPPISTVFQLRSPGIDRGSAQDRRKVGTLPSPNSICQLPVFVPVVCTRESVPQVSPVSGSVP
jgi:hypothetical protein